VTGAVASLPSSLACANGTAYTPRWECASISPGVTNLPVPSITRAPAGTATLASLPSAAIAPPDSTIVPPSTTLPVAVMIVAWRIAIAGALGSCSAAARSRVGRLPRGGVSAVGSTQESAMSSVGGSGLATLGGGAAQAASPSKASTGTLMHPVIQARASRGLPPARRIDRWKDGCKITSEP